MLEVAQIIVATFAKGRGELIRLRICLPHVVYSHKRAGRCGFGHWMSCRCDNSATFHYVKSCE